MKVFKVVKWLFLIGFVLGLLLILAGPLLLNTARAREQISAILSDALDREVTMGGHSVGLLLGRVQIEDLRVGNPDDFPEGTLLQADELQLVVSVRELLGGRIEGVMTGEGVTLHILKRGEKTNLHGLAPESSESSGDGPDLWLQLHLKDSRVVIEDLDQKQTLELDGVDIDVFVSNRAGRENTRLQLHVASMRRGPFQVRDLTAVLLHTKSDEGERIDVTGLQAKLGAGGRLVGSMSFPFPRGCEQQEWQASLELKDVGIDDSIRPLAQTLFPIGASDRAQFNGLLQGSFELRGRGITWDAIKPQLSGSGKVRLTRVSLAPGNLITLLTRWAGREPKPLELNDCGAEFTIEPGRVKFQRLSARGDEVRYYLKGWVTLDGALRLNIDAMPLLERYSRREADKLKRYIKEIPIPIRGTISRPRPKLPRMADLLTQAGKDGLLDWLGKKLGKELERQTKKKNR
ncbi:MAG: hypothetical protein O7C98_03505 [Planctomycetota bacterium]|nr:hypothetical protein [Planctomycetota bacterium]